MIEFGKTLREAREAKGLSIAQVAESTHMMSQIVEGLENEDFSRIVAPIYGRGFVKLYCEAVGLDPKELTAAFMEIYNGSRVETSRDHAVQPEAAPEPVETVEAPEEPLAPPPASSFFEQPADVEPPKPMKKRAFKMPEMSMPEVPPSLWRMATLVAIVIVVIWVAFIGVRALYRATMTAPEPPETSAATVATPVQTEKKAVPPQTTANPDGTKKTIRREPMRVPPLYVD